MEKGDNRAEERGKNRKETGAGFVSFFVKGKPRVRPCQKGAGGRRERHRRKPGRQHQGE